MKTYMATTRSLELSWYLVNADGEVMGRLASELAKRLRGKNKPEFTPHMNTGDFFIVVNADKIHVTGKKRTEKKYYWHTGYPGGIKFLNFEGMQKRNPGKVLEKAVKGMLPKGPLGRQMLKKLKIYAGGNHPHSAQKPRHLCLDEAE